MKGMSLMTRIAHLELVAIMMMLYDFLQHNISSPSSYYMPSCSIRLFSLWNLIILGLHVKARILLLSSVAWIKVHVICTSRSSVSLLRPVGATVVLQCYCYCCAVPVYTAAPMAVSVSAAFLGRYCRIYCSSWKYCITYFSSTAIPVLVHCYSSILLPG